MKKLVSILLVCMMVFSLAACQPTTEQKPPVDNTTPPADNTTPPANDAGKPTTLIAGITEMSGNFGPLYYSSSYDGFVVDLIYQPLLRLNEEGILTDYLAESHKVEENGKDITFKIKEGATFSDGQPVKAEDIVFTYAVMADPTYTGRMSQYSQDLVSYDECRAGTATEFTGVEAVDEKTVVFHFKDALRTNLENTAMGIMPKHQFPDYKMGDTAAIEAAVNAPLGSGPYMLKEFKGKEYVSLVKNEHYNGNDYEISNIVMKFVDETTEIPALTTGEVSLLVGQIEPTKIDEALKSPDITASIYPRSGYGYVKLNCEAGPTKEKEVRQALYYSFNVAEFVNSYFKDEATGNVLASVQYHPFSQVSWVIDDAILKELPDYSFDMAKAQKLLDDAGWAVGASGFREKNGEVLEIKIAAMPDHDILNTLIPMWQRDWGEQLKCKVSVAYLEFNTLLDLVTYNSDANVNEWTLYFMATSIPSADPHSVYNDYHSSQIGSGKDNTNRYNNPEVDKILDEGKTIMDVDKAKEHYKKLVKIIADEAVLIPVYANTYYDLYNKKITNFKTSSLYPWTTALKDAKIVE